MNVAILTPSLSPSGGAEVYNRRLFEFLQSKGHVIDLILNEQTTVIHDTTRSYHVPRRTFQLPVLWRVSPALRFAWYVAQAVALPIRKPDLIIGTADPLSCTLAWRYPQACFVYLPHFLTLAAELSTVAYGSRLQLTTMRWLSRRLEYWTLNRADCTIRFSQYSAQLMLREYRNTVKPRFYFLPQSVDVPTKWRSDAPSGAPRLLFVGRLIETKNCRLIIESLTGLQHLDWTFDIIGNGPQLEELKTRVEELGLAGRVRFAGHQADTCSFYQSADLLLFPSKRENQPLVVLEAMSQGTPTLGMRRQEPDYLNALDEVIVDGQNGYLADGELDFRQRLERILCDPAGTLGTAIRTQARKTAAGTHSAADVLERFHTLIQGLVNNPGRSNIY